MLVELVYAVASFLAMTVMVVYSVALLPALQPFAMIVMVVYVVALFCGLQLFGMIVMVVYAVALFRGLQLFGMTGGRDDSWMCF